MKEYILKTINRVKSVFNEETFNAQKAHIISKIAKVQKTREQYKELNKRADKLCKEIKVKWLEEIKDSAEKGKIGITFTNPRIEMLNSELVYTKLLRKFKKLGYKVERNDEGFDIDW